MVKTTQANHLYKKRKPSIEPVFALIKELFDLEGEKQLPYKSLTYVQAFLITTVIFVQLMMIDNHVNKQEFANTNMVLTIFR